MEPRGRTDQLAGVRSTARPGRNDRGIGVAAAVAVTAVVLAAASGALVAVNGMDGTAATQAARGPGTSEPVSTTTEAVPSTTSTAPTTTTTTTTTTPTTTTAPPEPTTTTTAPPPEPQPVDLLRMGDSGPEVAAVQQRLVELNFWLPAVDGHYGSVTAQAVMAFQKSAGLSADGLAGPNTRAALEAAGPVGPREGGDHIEVDLARQLMFVVRGPHTYVFNTSTGVSGWRTPPGRFQVYRQIDGVRHAPLGDLYRPKYFTGGVALHGSPSIPGYPASHGCTRLHDAAVDFIWANGLAPIGTPVWVY
jgi:peptidoglycan hydrolase-like protein with peptidoglycan-binding domain